MAVLRLTDEEPVLRRNNSSLPVRLLPDERTALDERELLPPVTTRAEELRLEPLSIRRVEPLPERSAATPVRDELDDAAVRDEVLPA